MKSIWRPIWAEGLLLSPQHLQAQDRYHEGHLEARVRAANPDAWGVWSLELDEAALVKGSVRLVRFEGVMPDGLTLSFDEESAPPARSVGDHFGPTMRSLPVLIAVPRERPGVPSASSEPLRDGSRHLLAVQQLEDGSREGVPVAVSMARPAPAILLGAEGERGDHEVLQVAELVRDGSGRLALSPSHVPPCLRTGASSVLGERLRRVAAALVARYRSVAEARRQGLSLASDVPAVEVARSLQLAAVAAAIPGAIHLVENPDLPPRLAFLQLASAMAQLGSLAGEDPTSPPRYDHRMPSEGFRDLFDRLDRTLKVISVAEEFGVIKLETRSGVSSGSVAAVAEDPSPRLYLVVKSELPRAEVVDRLPRMAKISSQAKIFGLMSSSAIGLPIAECPPPPQLPQRPGSVVFRVLTGDRDAGFHEEWRGIAEKKLIAIYLPPQFSARSTLELFHLGQPGGGSP